MDQMKEQENDPEYQKEITKLYALINGRESQMLQPTTYSPLR